jgi:transcriptional regulator with XRE-family HTH domain
MSDSEQLGYYIRKAREAAGLTQAQLAEAIGVSRPTVTQLERGLVKYPKVYMLSAIATALNLPPSALFAQAGVSSPEVLSVQLQWVASQLDSDGVELLVELGMSLVRERQRRREKAGKPTSRRSA